MLDKGLTFRFNLMDITLSSEVFETMKKIENRRICEHAGLSRSRSCTGKVKWVDPQLQEYCKVQIDRPLFLCETCASFYYREWFW